MVKVGDFTVELVAADTKEAFKEHTAPDGQVYAEVEPDMDYFVSVKFDKGGVMTFIFVDGVDLGYHMDFKSPGKTSYGRWERIGGKQTMTALHFNKTRQEVGTTPDMLTGKVELKIHKMGEKYYEEPRDFVSRSLTADSTLGGKKCIKSTTSGSHSLDITPKGRTASSKIVNRRKGEHLHTITLNYCSALGLIYNKILPPPPDSDTDDDSVQVKRENSRRKRKRSTETSVSTVRVPPQGNIKAEKNSRVETVTVQQTYDLVDLTGDD
mmetsp:Transcript_11136/g.19025  ORF Transcript_11136/g.19025 Transcript_11136/m.19025 type:complete len:267 (-) Transcript_11136:104-904(-)